MKARERHVLTTCKLVSRLVGVLSPLNHIQLYQGNTMCKRVQKPGAENQQGCKKPTRGKRLQEGIPEWRTLWQLYRSRVAKVIRRLHFQSGERYEDLTFAESITLWELYHYRVVNVMELYSPREVNVMRTLQSQSGERYENFTIPEWWTLWNFTVPEWWTLWELYHSRVVNVMRT